MAMLRFSSEPARIGQYLSCSAADIERALAIQEHERSTGNAISIGEILIARETVTSETLRTALEQQRKDLFSRSSLLAGLSDQQLMQVGGIAEEIGLSAGEALFTQGRSGDSLYIVTSGRILLSRRKPLDGDQPIAVALPGDVLSEASYFSKKEHSCTAWALDPAMLLKIRYEPLSSLSGIARDPHHASAGHATPPAGPPSGGDRDAWLAGISHRIAGRIRRVLNVENAFLFIRKPHTSEFVAYIAGQGSYRVFSSQSIPEIVDEAATELIRLNDAYFDDRFSAQIDVWTGQWTRTFMAGPMQKADNTLVGVIEVINKANGFFDKDDETVFRAVAYQFAPIVGKCGMALATKS